jgi:hypothetical protein
MKVHSAALVAGLVLCLSVIARAQYEYDYSYGYDFYDGEDDCESSNRPGLH